MRFSTTKIKIIISVLFVISLFVINCVPNQSNINDPDYEFLISKAESHWQQRSIFKDARLAKHFYSKAISISQPNLELTVKLIRAYYFVGHYIETDSIIKDSLFQQGAKIAMDFIHQSKVYKSISDTSNSTVDEIDLLTLQNLDLEYVPVIYWWVANFGRYLISKPIGERLQYVDIVQAGLQRLIELDPDYYYGGPYRLLGTLYVRVPGFDIELAQNYFQASYDSYPNCFSTSVLMAQYCCTKANNRVHFHTLLENVANADPTIIPDIEPENRFEQNFAKQLLKMEFLLFE